MPTALVPVDYDPFFDVAQQGPSDPNALVRLGPGGVTPAAAPNALAGALEAAYGLTGVPDLQAAYAAAARGEPLPALGQGAAGAAALIPALKPLALAPMAAMGIRAASKIPIGPIANALGRSENALLPAGSEVNRAVNALTGLPIMSPEEQALLKYIGEDPYYNAITINNLLRNGQKLPKEHQQVVDSIDNLLNKAPPLEKDTTFYRGTDKNYYSADPREKGFLSVTIDPSVAEDFATSSSLTPEQRAIYKITVPKGTPALDISSYQSSSMDYQKEFLLPRNAIIRPSGGHFPNYEANAVYQEPIRVYHGSPYDFPAEAEVIARDGTSQFFPLEQSLPPEITAGIKSGDLTVKEHPLGRFDLKKIGTGEGAQVYGHGLYFAETPGVAQSYKDTLGNFQYYYDGKAVKLNSPKETAIATMVSAKNDIETARNQMDQLLKLNNNNKFFQNALNELNKLDLSKIEPAAKGRMYEVNINADPDTFLHWDKPLSEQPEGVRQNLDPMFEHLAVAHSGSADPTGEQIYRAIGSLSKEREVEGSRQHATEALRAAGISGIKYLDQGSRNFNLDNLEKEIAIYKEYIKDPRSSPDMRARYQTKVDQGEHILKEGVTHNYVVFDPKVIEIIKKYGLVPLIASGAFATGGNANAATHLVPVDHDPFAKDEEP